MVTVFGLLIIGFLYCVCWFVVFVVFGCRKSVFPYLGIGEVVMPGCGFLEVEMNWDRQERAGSTVGEAVGWEGGMLCLWLRVRP